MIVAGASVLWVWLLVSDNGIVMAISEMIMIVIHCNLQVVLMSDEAGL